MKVITSKEMRETGLLGTKIEVLLRNYWWCCWRAIKMWCQFTWYSSQEDEFRSHNTHNELAQKNRIDQAFKKQKTNENRIKFCRHIEQTNSSIFNENKDIQHGKYWCTLTFSRLLWRFAYSLMYTFCELNFYIDDFRKRSQKKLTI